MKRLIHKYKIWQYQRRVKRATDDLHRAVGRFPNRHEAIFELQSILAHQSTDVELKDHHSFIGRQLIMRTLRGGA